jgi:L-iditol 2-dehydrogenase
VRALVKPEQGAALRIEERPDPTPAAGEALVAVRAVGICGTDLHIVDDVYPHAQPLIPGHEFAAEVIGLGAAVKEGSATGRRADSHAGEGLRPGDRVVGELHVGACRVCEICLSGNPQICPDKRALGTWTDGAFAELLAIPAWLLHRIPERLSDPAATLIEPTACAWHAIFERSRLDRGDRVLVVGHGPIGLLSAHLAAIAGASQVIVVGRSGRGTARLECARALGFETVDASTEVVADRVAELTGGRGVDLAVETAGAEESLAACVRSCRRGGRIVVLGVSGRPHVPLPWDHALQFDLTLAFSFSSRARSWEGVLDMSSSGALPAQALLTHVLALEDWQAGFDAVRSGSAVKVVLTP